MNIYDELNGDYEEPEGPTVDVCRECGETAEGWEDPDGGFTCRECDVKIGHAQHLSELAAEQQQAEYYRKLDAGEIAP